ncbi:MAG: thiamine pyrophosphate-binding protein [Clostridia bacterium]|nr:thiamine pyrophosphate-binding protein [Clostridia bacterium]
MIVKLSDYVADFLVNSGINHVFTVTGGGAMHLNDSLGHKEGLKSIYNHHEQGCAIAAEGYTRLSGKLCAVCVTSGPGGTNAITGVLGGWLDSIPMFVISGQVKRETTTWSTDVPLRQLGDQEYNIVASVKPMTKYAVMVTEPNDIAYHLEKALYLSKTGRGGPVWLDIPLDVQAARIETDDLKHFDEAECADEKAVPVSDEEIDAVLAKLKEAKKPVIIAGTGIRLSGGHEEFVKMAEKLGIPVVTAWNAHDVLWDEHPLFCGRPGTVGTRGGNFIMENADLIMSIGCRLNIRQISYNFRNFSKNAYKIIVDIDKNELDKPTLSPDMKVCADAKDFMIKLTAAAEKSPVSVDEKWQKWCRNINEKYPAVLDEYKKTDKPLNPYVFMEGLFDCLEEGDPIITGNGSACVIAFQSANIKKGQRLFTNSGCASMGYGLPAALGGAVAWGDRRMICLDGDGSLMMNIQELQTISYNKLNFKLFVLNNNGYHSIRQTQTNLFKPPFVGVSAESGVSFPEFSKVADAFGFKYAKVDALSTMKEDIEAALAIDGPVLCEVFLDETQFFAPKLSSRVNPDGTIVSPPIDDMFPFLDREEYEANKFD